MSLSRGLIIKSGRPTLPQYRWRDPIQVNVVDPAVGVWVEAIAVIGDPLVEYLTVSNGGGNVWGVRITGDGQVITDAAVNTGGANHFMVLDEDTADMDNQPAAAPFATFGAGSYQSFRVEVQRTLAGADTMRVRLRYRQL